MSTTLLNIQIENILFSEENCDSDGDGDCFDNNNNKNTYNTAIKKLKITLKQTICVTQIYKCIYCKTTFIVIWGDQFSCSVHNFLLEQLGDLA